MNLKELNELRRRWRPDKSAVSRIYGCYVNVAKEIVSDLDEPLGCLPQEEQEKYLSLLKKALSGTFGRNLIDIVFSTQQVTDSDEHRMLMKLRSSGLKDRQTRQEFYQKVIESLDMGDSSYLLLLAHDSYDVPRRSKNGELDADASDAVFSYLVCAVCPVKEVRTELGYFPGDNEFHCASGQSVGAPDLGFLFPAFDDRSANIYHALFYSRKAGELHQEFIDAVFHTEPPMSAVEQKEAFQSALAQGLENACTLSVMQAIHERLTVKINEHKECKDQEPLSISVQDLCAILADCGVEEVRINAFRKVCADRFGENAALNPANLIDAGKVELKTEQVSVTVKPDSSYLLESGVLDGRRVLVIPVESSVEFNGFPVPVNSEN